MRVAVCSGDSLFAHGGAQLLSARLVEALNIAGHQVDCVVLPATERTESVIVQALSWRWVDVSTADLVICLRPPAHLVRHPNKVIWWLHHHRAFYDLWATEFGASGEEENAEASRALLRKIDTRGLREAKSVYSNSARQAARLQAFNDVPSSVLLPPLPHPIARAEATDSREVLCIGRLVPHKRQDLLVKALAHTKSDVVLRLMGPVTDAGYADELDALVEKLGLGKRVVVDRRWVDTSDKAAALASCLCVAYVPFDEDSYGYAALEAASAGKPVVTTRDSGGVLELVEDGVSGFVVDPNPKAIARALDQVAQSSALAAQLGDRAFKRYEELVLDWDQVVKVLTQ